ncbi:MAG: hypothetical protein U0X93_14460 [Anaerolineales bacterium]
MFRIAVPNIRVPAPSKKPETAGEISPRSLWAHERDAPSRTRRSQTLRQAKRVVWQFQIVLFFFRVEARVLDINTSPGLSSFAIFSTSAPTQSGAIWTGRARSVDKTSAAARRLN